MMFATHDDLATAELHVIESRRKIQAQSKIIDELRKQDQSTRLAEKFLLRLEQELTLHRHERNAIASRMQAEIA